MCPKGLMVAAFNISSSEKARITQHLLAGCAAQNPEKPVVHALCGIPGAGKSTFTQKALETGLMPQTAFILNPDRVMQALPAHHQLKTEQGQAAAFAAYEMPTRLLAHDIAAEAARRRYDMVVDMGHVRQENWDFLANLKQAGYNLVLHVIYAPLATCLARLQARADTQFYPAQNVQDRAVSLAQLLEKNVGLAHEVHVYDNTQTFTPMGSIVPVIKAYQQKTLSEGA